MQPHLVNELYQSHVALNFDNVKSLEADTKAKSDSELWYNARKLRITSSIMKEVCHRKNTASCEAFIEAFTSTNYNSSHLLRKTA